MPFRSICGVCLLCVHIICSDARGVRHVAGALAAAVQCVVRHCGAHTARGLVCVQWACMISDEVQVDPYMEKARGEMLAQRRRGCLPPAATRQQPRSSAMPQHRAVQCGCGADDALLADDAGGGGVLRVPKQPVYWRTCMRMLHAAPTGSKGLALIDLAEGRRKDNDDFRGAGVGVRGTHC